MVFLQNLSNLLITEYMYTTIFMFQFMFHTWERLPLDMIKTTIVPVIKNKCGNLADSNNYRPIAIATIISKLYESTILYECEYFLSTCDNQFGFKRKHSTEFCIYTLKEFIDYYKQRGTTIFVTFLDASKGFDKIDFLLLFQN